MPTKEETRAQLRKFLELCVKQDFDAQGEHAIDKWEEYLEKAGDYLDIYKLSEAEKAEIKFLIDEFRQTCEQEEMEREQLSAEDQADEALANHYADRIRKIVFAKPNKFFPKPKSKLTTRSKTH